MKEINEKHMKKIYLNVLKAIIIMLYFFVLNVAYSNVSALYMEKGIEICTMIFLFATIFIFEVAYKKDDDDLALQGIELLVLATYTLTCQHITKKYKFDFKNYTLVASYIFAIYFILKGIVIYTKGRKEMAEDLSDIKEIVMNDKPIKKEATKKQSKKRENEIEIKENLENKENTENKEKAKTPKKRTTTKNTSKINKTTNEKTTPTKKTTSTRKTSNKKKTDLKIEEAEKEEKPKTTRKRTTSKKTAESKTSTEKVENEEKPKTTRKRTTTKKSTATKKETVNEEEK